MVKMHDAAFAIDDNGRIRRTFDGVMSKLGHAEMKGMSSSMSSKPLEGFGAGALRLGGGAARPVLPRAGWRAW